MNETMNPQVPPMSGTQDNPFDQAIPNINLGSETTAPNPFDSAGIGNEPTAQNPFDAPQQPPQFMPQSNVQQMASQVPQGNFQQAPVQEFTQPAADSLPAVPAAEAQNPIAAAMEIQMPGAEGSIYAKLPVFVHGSVNEEIEDITQTFEDLRILKADDFPELEDGARVTWEVSYGKVRKSLALKDAKATRIGELKSAIETSKEFTDALKKSKDKNPVCTIKPRVSAQSKGVSNYKGIFTTLEDAGASNKVISIVPGRDGRVFEIRREEAGTFTLPVGDCKELSEVKAGFIPALPLVPNKLLLEVITFFRSLLFTKSGCYEAIANLYWDRELQQYAVHVPKQSVSATRAFSDLSHTSEPDSERYLHYMDIHSHHVMPAKFSVVDDRDEKATRLYCVIGRLDNYLPQISLRMGVGGRHLALDLGDVFEPLYEQHPDSWGEQVTFAATLDVLPHDGICKGAAA